MANRQSNPQPPSGSFFKAISAIVWKDILAEYRSLELVSAMSVFSLLVIIIFNFALDLDIKDTPDGNCRSVMGNLRLRRDIGTQPFHVRGKRSRLSGRSFACAC